jgi:hypothetical protein
MHVVAPGTNKQYANWTGIPSRNRFRLALCSSSSWPQRTRTARLCATLSRLMEESRATHQVGEDRERTSSCFPRWTWRCTSCTTPHAGPAVGKWRLRSIPLVRPPHHLLLHNPVDPLPCPISVCWYSFFSSENPVYYLRQNWYNLTTHCQGSEHRRVTWLSRFYSSISMNSAKKMMVRKRDRCHNNKQNQEQ